MPRTNRTGAAALAIFHFRSQFKGESVAGPVTFRRGKVRPERSWLQTSSDVTGWAVTEPRESVPTEAARGRGGNPFLAEYAPPWGIRPELRSSPRNFPPQQRSSRMTRQAYSGIGPRFTSLAVLSAFGLLACASPSTTGGNTGGTTGGGTGGAQSTGGTGGTHTGGTTGTGGTHTGGTTGTGGSVSTGGTTGTGGSVSTGGTTGTGGSGTGTGGSVSTGGTTGTGGTHTGGTTGTGGSATGGTTGTGGGAAGSNGSCKNTNTSTINLDSSGYICGNQWGIQGAWYCYSSDTSSPCSTAPGAIPWTSASNGMCLSGTIASGRLCRRRLQGQLGTARQHRHAWHLEREQHRRLRDYAGVRSQWQGQRWLGCRARVSDAQ